MMIRCRSFKRLVVLLGMAILLPSVVAWAQAPLCTQILMATHEKPTFESILENLAHIQMSLDIAKAQGTYTTTQRKLSGDFNTRMAEFIKAQKLKISEKEIRELVKIKILALQRQNKDNSSQEQEARRQQAQVLKTYPLIKRIELKVTANPNIIDHIPQLDALVFHDTGSKKLYLFDLQTENLTLLMTDVYEYQLRGTELFMITTKGEIYVQNYDDKSNIYDTPKIINPQSNISISTFGDWLIATHDSEISIFNSRTGEDAPGALKLPQPEKRISFTTFLDNSKVLLGRERDQDLYLFDILSGELKIFPTGTNSLLRAYANPQGQILFMTNTTELVSIKTADLPDFAEKAEHIPGNFQAVKFMPNSESVYIKYIDEAIQRGIFSVNGLRNPNYNFPALNLGGAENSSSSPAFDTEGKRIFTGGRHKNPNGSIGHHIDIWNELNN